jgi:hypothetical protein
MQFSSRSWLDIISSSSYCVMSESFFWCAPDARCDLDRNGWNGIHFKCGLLDYNCVADSVFLHFEF